jgi:signal peptidase I
MLIAFAIRYFVIQPFVVDGDSMLPTFINNEYLIAEKVSYDFKQPSRGDVVIFRYPKNPEIIYIKRVIGLPGEQVVIKGGKVFVAESASEQPKEINEKYIPSSVKTEIFSQTGPDSELKVLLKDNEFFVLGDNRDHSSDSREWGVLPKANIIGRVWITVTPLDRFKIWVSQHY